MSKKLKLPLRSIHPDNCPACKVSLIGEPIPKDIANQYAGTHWRREIGIYDLDKDLTVAFRCPDCKVEWDSLTGEIIGAL